MPDYIDSDREYTVDDRSELAEDLRRTYQDLGFVGAEAAPTHSKVRDSLTGGEALSGHEIRREAARDMYDRVREGQYDAETRQQVEAFCESVLPEDEWGALDE